MPKGNHLPKCPHRARRIILRMAARENGVKRGELLEHPKLAALMEAHGTKVHVLRAWVEQLVEERVARRVFRGPASTITAKESWR